MDDWRDNKYGLESEYSALNDAEDWKFGLSVVAVVVAFLAAAGGLAWWLLSL